MSSENYRYIGKATARKDALDIVTGATKFIDDIKMPGMLHGKVLRSPHAHANIKHVDTTKAAQLKGVKAVLTYEDVPDWKIGIPEPHQRVLDRRVRYVGDGVALVAATTPEIAEEALDLIDVDYEILSFVLDMDDASESNATPLYDAYPNNILPSDCPSFGPKSLKAIVRGDVEKGFEEADFVAEGTYGYENIPNPLPPEPPGVIVSWDGPQKMKAWASVQCPNFLKMKLGIITRVPEIRVIGVPCGGSYGSKITTLLISLQAAALAKVTNKPVKLYYSKEEHLSAYVLRLGSRIVAKIGMKKDGTVTAGNASKISDGAAAVVLMAREKADAMGLKPMAQIGAQCSAGIDPKYVLVAPIIGIPKVLKKAGLSTDDIDIFEINEAFSSSSVAIIKTLGLDLLKVNLRGGAVAIGHPIGASGARVLVTLLYLMEDKGAQRGLASLCLGGGEAVCLILERD
jgi:CO/xanthine dehydrogenase Mo-binding subunit